MVSFGAAPSFWSAVQALVPSSGSLSGSCSVVGEALMLGWGMVQGPCQWARWWDGRLASGQLRLLFFGVLDP